MCQILNLLTSSDQGSNTHKITDVWVYVNDQFLGAFEIPAYNSFVT